MAAVDCFLKLEGIEGESHDSKHKGEIDLESWSWGVSQHGSHGAGGGGGAGKAVMQDFHCVMKMSKVSPKLFLACATGEHIKKATLTCRKAGKEQQEYLKVEMEDLLVSSYQIGGNGDTDIVPSEQISLNYSKYQIEYKPQNYDGSLGGAVKAGYNLKENKKV
jgi:type VI secretion system secreted protein Hcp